MMRIKSFEEGMSKLEIRPGGNTISSKQGMELVFKIERLTHSVSKQHIKKMKAFRCQIITAFGPDMVDRVGW